MRITIPGNTAYNKLRYCLDWLLFLPIAILLPPVAKRIVNTWLYEVLGSSYVGLAPDTMAAKAIVGTAESVVFGASFVCLGVYLVPAGKRIVAYVAVGTIIFFECIGLFIKLSSPVVDYLKVSESVATLVGALASSYFILHRGFLIPKPSKVDEQPMPGVATSEKAR